MKTIIGTTFCQYDFLFFFFNKEFDIQNYMNIDGSPCISASKKLINEYYYYICQFCFIPKNSQCAIAYEI